MAGMGSLIIANVRLVFGIVQTDLLIAIHKSTLARSAAAEYYESALAPFDKRSDVFVVFIPCTQVRPSIVRMRLLFV